MPHVPKLEIRIERLPREGEPAVGAHDRPRQRCGNQGAGKSRGFSTRQLPPLNQDSP